MRGKKYSLEFQVFEGLGAIFLWGYKLKLRLFIINTIPIIVLHFMLLPLWFIMKSQNITTIESLLNILVGITLLRWNFNYTRRLNSYNYLLQISLMISSMVLGGFLHYLNWGIWSGNLTNPDNMTVLFLQSETFLLVAVVLIVGIIQQLLLIKHKKSNT